MFWVLIKIKKIIILEIKFLTTINKSNVIQIISFNSKLK